MKLTEFFVAQLDREVASSRAALLRVPEGHNDWKPHERSMPLGYLASLVATMPSWIVSMVKRDELDLKSPEAAKFKPLEWQKREELIAALEKAAAEAREALRGTTDEHLLTKWRFAVGEHVVSENPRHVMIADSVFSHLAHHRGQLTVYLRLNEATVPALYGPSADEGLAA
ncbi:MAG TPA: DinB family protein [Candidatus Binatia bacterium]|nr:DinB family protein [Candidatus Binatia bacterium]